MNIEEIKPQKKDHSIWLFLKKQTKNYKLVPKSTKKYQKRTEKYQQINNTKHEKKDLTLKYRKKRSCIKKTLKKEQPGDA